MSATGTIAKRLRAAFKTIPDDLRASRQSFAVRVHRALSWLERAGEHDDLETRFIYRWIAFNALYGQARHGQPTARSQRSHGGGDRDEYITFLNRIAQLDDEPLLKAASPIRRYLEELVGSPYLYFLYWRNVTDWPERLDCDTRDFGRAMERRDAGRVLSMVFDRLYTMRLQLFHGGATFASQVNRETVRLSEMVLGRLLPAILEVMITCGADTDWGEFAYPPCDQDGRQAKEC